MDSNHSLQQEITAKGILKFTLPSIIMMVIMSMYTVVDGTFVSRLVGTDAFSAVNIVYPMLSLILALGTMFGTGVTAVAATRMGEGKQREANENVSFVIAFTIVIGAVCSLIAFLFLEEIIRFLGANDAIYDYCYQYALPLVFFFPANILQLQFQSLFVAAGKPKVGLWVTVSGGLANVILDYVFIAIFGMGITGAAVATGIGYCVPAFYGLFYFTSSKRQGLRFVRPRTDWRVLRKTMSNGSSEMVSNLSGSIITLLFNIIMMRFIGQDGVAAISILLYMDFVLIAISLGYSMGVAPLFSYNYGCGNREKIRKLFRLSAWLTGLVGLVMTTGTVIFAKQLAGIFTPRGTAVYELAVGGLGIYAFSYLFKGYNIFASSMFTAFGDGRVSALLSFMHNLVFLTLCLVGLSALFGVDGVWFATPVAEALSICMAIQYTLRYGGVYHYLEKREKRGKRTKLILGEEKLEEW